MPDIFVDPHHQAIRRAKSPEMGYPDFVVHEYKHWVVIVRYGQTTLGSVWISNTIGALTIPELSNVAMLEFKQVITDYESVVKKLFGALHVNYLFHMNFDKHVHCHAYPRYASAKKFKGVTFPDNWPSEVSPTSKPSEPKLLLSLKDAMQKAWPKAL